MKGSQLLLARSATLLLACSNVISWVYSLISVASMHLLIPFLFQCFNINRLHKLFHRLASRFQDMTLIQLINAISWNYSSIVSFLFNAFENIFRQFFKKS